MRKDILLPGVAVVGGAAGFLLRRWELSTAFEPDTGLPVAGAPATWALIALTVVVAAVLAVLCRGTHRVFPGGYDEAFGAPTNALYLTVLVAAAFLIMAWQAGTEWSLELRLWPFTGNWPSRGI